MTKKTPKSVEIFSDGACSGNPGPGGWAALLRYRKTEKLISGGETPTTNNRMELKAVIEALRLLKEPCTVKITTDSQYVMKAFTDGWLAKWQENGWKTAAGKPVANKDLWEELGSFVERHTLSWRWVKGHAGHDENERVDEEARKAIGRLLIQLD